ncbi:hypothetical protein QNL75_27030 [Pseudomonas amygdali pv. morsprunorum]|uniref:hypothetical protein n=1 Tax=Pseudomonas amygdali TaxID=47877 RepID=UPI00288F1E0F|nr:hypothetical protein [Pseudomonas amygdali]MDT3268713.1 hypothetical protein [Pseudomonas amygdali pv. morsprunorum]
MSANFLDILDARVAYEKAAISGDVFCLEEAAIEAHIAGANAQLAGENLVPVLFKNVPQLSSAWLEGWTASLTGSQWRKVQDDEFSEPTEESMEADWAEMIAMTVDDDEAEDLSHIPDALWDQYPFASHESESDCFDDDESV